METSLPDEAQPASRSLDIKHIVLSLGVLILLSVLYFPVVVNMARQWLSDPNYRHGILIPIISGVILWQRRSSLRAAADERGSIVGLLVVIAASVVLILGTAASEFFTQRFSLPVMIIGILLCLYGWKYIERGTLPLLLLFMMVPLPYIIYFKITFPLQFMSARISAGVLNILHINVIRKGNILHLPNYSLEVVAACSGLRSLMTMVTLALILAALSGLSTVRKIILIVCAIPVAVAANTFRLVVTAIGAYTIGPSFAEGVLHEISGLIVFLSGFLLLALTYGILRWSR
jgi:exosortase